MFCDSHLCLSRPFAICYMWNYTRARKKYCPLLIREAVPRRETHFFVFTDISGAFHIRKWYTQERNHVDMRTYYIYTCTHLRVIIAAISQIGFTLSRRPAPFSIGNESDGEKKGGSGAKSFEICASAFRHFFPLLSDILSILKCSLVIRAEWPVEKRASKPDSQIL